MEAAAQLLGSWQPAGYFQQCQLFEKTIKQNPGGCMVVLMGATSLEEERGQGPAEGALLLSGSPCVPGAEEVSWASVSSKRSWGRVSVASCYLAVMAMFAIARG